ncbi:hypothetical protein AJ79_10345, partial [Helicocarpus griseus UAMH5409]
NPSEDKIKLLREGRCFNCKKTDHIATDCLKKASTEVHEMNTDVNSENE